ncbi:TetR/AcrR family transcriptional regulator [Saccharothrix violaceirubra]|uniref:AcrR family transcriptional regulator n=1 Tax=Saccharothrix violaceirubra TaxID=413306 RepID=A0A7W7WY33_9PSEU|nr:TetR/AcrR family transcriptional regulator [Saccharothrix violaceirubra]MBB4968000.1 AcrR family transcriptional regulator [Saccharothrix violaceirubra]
MPEETVKRRRAPAMSTEDRRQAIIDATVPLLFEHGAKVTTSQIARASGIAEGTVFRAFKDKQELIKACVRAALGVEDELGRLRQARLVPTLHARLALGIAAVADYLDRMWRLMGALGESGYDAGADRRHDDGPPKEMLRISAHLAALFEPDADALRVDPELAARLLLGLVFTNRMRGAGFGDTAADGDGLVDVFLHGVLRGAER